ncbi:hypothetical protein WJ58_14555 [Burkholderia ubonensis]|nr:hypothetical protein WJ58_14555 [Burkholderia ubonensis]
MRPRQLAVHFRQVASKLPQFALDPPQVGLGSSQLVTDLRQLAAGACQFVVKSPYFVLRVLDLFANGLIFARAAFLETGSKVDQGQPVIGSERFVEKSSLFLIA